MKRILGLLLMLVVGSVISGCSVSKMGPAESTPLSDKGDTRLDIGKVPDDFPGDIPVYKNIRSLKAITGGVKLLHMQSSDTKAQILDFYRRELTAAQWKLTVESRSEREEILAGKQQRSVTVSIVDKGAAGRVIDITY
jgi:hypothetical protein